MINEIIVGITVTVLGGFILYKLKNRFPSKLKSEGYQPPDLTTYDDPNRILKFKYPADLGKINPYSDSGFYGFRILKGFWGYLIKVGLINPPGDDGNYTYMHIILFEDLEKENTWDKFLIDQGELSETPFFPKKTIGSKLDRIFLDGHLTCSKIGDGSEHSYYKEFEFRLFRKKCFAFLGYKESDGVWLEVSAEINGEKRWNNFRDSIRASFESVSFDSSKAKEKLRKNTE